MERIAMIGVWIKTLFSDGYNVAAGIIASIFGYFLPVREPVHLLVIFFIVDSLVGWWKNKVVNGEKFCKRKIFDKTLPRMLFVVALIMMLFMLDEVFKQEFAKTYMFVGYFFGGALIWNIRGNAYEITRWYGFVKVGDILKKHVKDHTGVELSEMNEEKDEEINNGNNEKKNENRNDNKRKRAGADKKTRRVKNAGV